MDPKVRRRISSSELEVLSAWLAHDVPGAERLRSQLSAEMEVYSSCDCGCSSIGFVHAAESTGQGRSIFGIDAEVVGEDGESIGGMMLTIRGGQLYDVDVHSWFDEIPFPTVHQVRFRPRPAPE